MIKEFKRGNRRYGIISGDGYSIITETDFCHEIIPNNGGLWIDGKPVTVAEIAAEAMPIESLATWAHYWGIKPRTRKNYRILLDSMKEIDADVSSMPEWGK